MCLLWVLLQFVVLAMYWDVAPISSEGGEVMLEMKQAEGNEEEVPLMGPDEEPVHTYRAVDCNQLKTPEASEMQPVRGASAVSNPFKNFSASRGEGGGLTACPEQWLPIQGLQRQRWHCQCTCVVSALLIFLHAHTHILVLTYTFILQVSLKNSVWRIRSPLYWLDLCVCVWCMSCVCVYVYIYDVRYLIGLVSW